MSATAPRVVAGSGAPPRAARAEIDLSALAHNLACVRAAAPGAKVLAAVKSDAYGHGLLTVAEALHAADGLAVARVEEAVTLRKAGILRPIVALQGVRVAEELVLAAQHDVQVTVHAEYQVALLAAARLPRPVGVWLKIDTGMHRMGIPPQSARETFARLTALSTVRGTPVLMTHLARADERDCGMTEWQIEVFDTAVAGLEAEHSIANSAGLLGWKDSQRDWVRPGIMLYGASPFVDQGAQAVGLRPVMTLKAPLIAIQRLRRGDSVGYGASFVCPEDMPVGVAAIGYGDGYPRGAGNAAPVIVNGRRTRLVGRVSMDVITLDLRGIDAQVGDEVTLWGAGLPVDEVAEAAGTISYELLCRVGGRLTMYVKPSA